MGRGNESLFGASGSHDHVLKVFKQAKMFIKSEFKEMFLKLTLNVQRIRPFC